MIFHSPVPTTNTSKPPSSNKSLLQDDGGDEEEDELERQEQKERKEELERLQKEKELSEELRRPFIESKLHAEFAYRVLTEEWAKVFNSKEKLIRSQWKTEMSGFLIFAQHLLDICGEEGVTVLEGYLSGEQLKSPKPTWMGEFLRLKIGKSKLLTLMKKITKDAGEIGLELIDILKVIQSANSQKEAFKDFNFEELAAYAKSVDTCELRPGKELKVLVSSAADSIVEVIEAIFRAAACMICCDVSVESEDDVESIACEEDSAELSKFEAMQSQMSATENKLSDLSLAVEKLTVLISNMMTNDTQSSGKPAVILPPRKQLSKTVTAALNPKPLRNAFPGIGLKQSEVRSDFVHEKRAIDIDTSQAMKKLMGSDNKGSSLVHENEVTLTFNDLYSRGSPPNQKFERIATQPNRYLDLLLTGSMILPLLGLILQPLNSRATHSAVDKLGRTIVSGRGLGTTLIRDVVHIPALDKQLTPKEWLPIVSGTSQTLPASYPHLVRLLTEQVASVKEVIISQGPFEDEEMLPLIEQNIATFISNMGEAAAKLLDGIKEPCMSPDGHWRGLLILFWHQYSRSFSSRKDDFHSVFFPEMLNDNFEDNREKLFNDYRFKVAQLTCEMGNAMRISCWNCGVSDVPYQSCISSECRKKRTEEEHLHVYVAKALGPSGAKTYVGKLYRA